MAKQVNYRDPSLKRNKLNHTAGLPKGKPAKSGQGQGMKDHTLLLTNHFILTKEMHRRYSRETFRLYRGKWRKKVILLGVIVIGVALLLCIALKWYIPAALLFLFGIYCLCMSRFGYLYGSTVEYRQLQEFFGPCVEMDVEFYPRYLRVRTEKGKSEFLYSQIRRRIEFDDMAILIVEAEGIITHGQVIDKKAFAPTELGQYYDILEDAGVEIEA